MADAPITTPSAPLTEDAFLADRQKFWAFFTGLTFRAAVAAAVILVLMAYFLL